MEDDDTIARSLESSVQKVVERDLDDKGTMIVGWVLVAEFVDSNGQRALVTTSGGTSGDRPPEWQRDGYLVSALKAGWEEDTSGDD